LRVRISTLRLRRRRSSVRLRRSSVVLTVPHLRLRIVRVRVGWLTERLHLLMQVLGLGWARSVDRRDGGWRRKSGLGCGLPRFRLGDLIGEWIVVIG
jgi:hypothetical protein